MGKVLETTFTKNSTNPDRFARGLLETNKKLDDIMKSLEYRILFFSKSANLCLLKKSV